MKNSGEVMFSGAVALGAFLLFVLEPLAGKIATPLYGGTAGVWSVLLLFFQLAVLAGYAITFCIARLNGTSQSVVYGVLAFAAAASAYLGAPIPWSTPDVAHPELSLLVGLGAHFGVAAVFLATISGVMQIWLQRVLGSNPYPLYGLSNAGSLVALIAYPFLIEPNMTIGGTALAWRAGLLVVCVVICICAVIAGRSEDAGVLEEGHDGPAVSFLQCFWWCLLAATTSGLLVSMTAFITQDIAPMPLLWIPPLALYLLSFIIPFSGKGKRLMLVAPFFVLAGVATYPALDFGAVQPSILFSIAVCLLFFFFACLLCHGELYGTRPHASRLALFYLMIALGGAGGGIACSILSPMLVNQYVEHWLLMGLLIAVAARVVTRKEFDFVRDSAPGNVAYMLILAACGASLMLAFFVQLDGFHSKNVVCSERNFYGTVRVLRKPDRIELYNGTVLHGVEYVQGARDINAAEYYAQIVDLVDQVVRTNVDGSRRYGVVGLGVGTLARWMLPHDRLRFYEIDPKIERIARRQFSFLHSCKSKVDVVLGDARASLRNEHGQFDLLIVDAFNGDAIPMHLLTAEAVALYKQRVKPDGAILVHVSNHYLDLVPVLANAAAKAGLRSVYLHKGTIRYVLMTSDEALLKRLQITARAKYPLIAIEPAVPDPNKPSWTDDFCNIFSVLRTN